GARGGWRWRARPQPLSRRGADHAAADLRARGARAHVKQRRPCDRMALLEANVDRAVAERAVAHQVLAEPAGGAAGRGILGHAGGGREGPDREWGARIA